MNEAYVRTQVNEMFRRMGVNADTQTDGIVCPRCHCVVVPPCGRPDVTMVHPTARSCYVEAKIVKLSQRSFAFKSISAEQRAWLASWADRGGLGFIALGVISRPKKLEKLAHLYLVEWTAWLEVERAVSEHQDSIPVVAGKGFARALQENGLDIKTQFAGWELERIKGGWAIPGTHPAHKLIGGTESAK